MFNKKFIEKGCLLIWHPFLDHSFGFVICCSQLHFLFDRYLHVFPTEGHSVLIDCLNPGILHHYSFFRLSVQSVSPAAAVSKKLTDCVSII